MHLDDVVSSVGRLVGSPRLGIRFADADGGSCGRCDYCCWSLDPLETIPVDPNSSYETFPISHPMRMAVVLVDYDV
eukprot:CAMPEP_0201664558 /NCGR_PEP_ID=MMETSP0494-20130426/5988_1 /ASSEMBLY_ACC=CAM_ASM_000839 /TAXON_ID=420259 /ORGANISM="Thalassiosira gravida, Strain GMp14c1" /LENGTH=75 /DNA_ID=CAMNT_0048143345 /DNA_START=147 /DNA_END=371 /DNA_ORIENTATION=-